MSRSALDDVCLRGLLRYSPCEIAGFGVIGEGGRPSVRGHQPRGGEIPAVWTVAPRAVFRCTRAARSLSRHRRGSPRGRAHSACSGSARRCRRLGQRARGTPSATRHLRAAHRRVAWDARRERKPSLRPPITSAGPRVRVLEANHVGRPGFVQSDGVSPATLRHQSPSLTRMGLRCARRRPPTRLRECEQGGQFASEQSGLAPRPPCRAVRTLARAC